MLLFARHIIFALLTSVAFAIATLNDEMDADTLNLLAQTASGNEAVHLTERTTNSSSTCAVGNLSIRREWYVATLRRHDSQ